MNPAQRIRDPEQWKDDVMSNFKKFAMASVAAGLAVTAANAADLPLAPVPIPVIQEFSGWYLRGDIGMTNQTVGSLTNYVAPGTSVGTKFLTFDSAPLFSLGGGYQLNSWLRMDVTGEYRGNAHFHGHVLECAVMQVPVQRIFASDRAVRDIDVGPAVMIEIDDRY